MAGWVHGIQCGVLAVGDGALRCLRVLRGVRTRATASVEAVGALLGWLAFDDTFRLCVTLAKSWKIHVLLRVLYLRRRNYRLP